jgi:hypothetical protein
MWVHNIITLKRRMDRISRRTIKDKDKLLIQNNKSQQNSIYNRHNKIGLKNGILVKI